MKRTIPSTVQRWLGVIVVALAVVAAGCGSGEQYAYASRVIDPAEEAPDIRLTEADGTQFVLSDSRADLVAVYFGYTHCPDVCPTTMADLATALGRMPQDERARVQVVMVTIDPERDTPEVMSTYVRYFDDGFVGLGGPPAEVHALLDAWGVSVQREGSNNASGDYYLSHPADVYVVDPAARQTVLEVPFGLPSEVIAEDLMHLLQEM